MRFCTCQATSRSLRIIDEGWVEASLYSEQRRLEALCNNSGMWENIKKLPFLLQINLKLDFFIFTNVI
jgi:hypothetical protein